MTRKQELSRQGEVTYATLLKENVQKINNNFGVMIDSDRKSKSDEIKT